jgi:hypothetical protein
MSRSAQRAAAAPMSHRAAVATMLGATGTVDTHFEGRYTRFENMSQRTDRPSSE